MGNKRTIALDIMGADVSPESIMTGGVMAAEDLGRDLQLVFVGKREVIEEFVNSQKNFPSNILFEYASHAVAMTDTPTEGIRKKNSSIAVGLNLVKEGRAGAFVSAGNTGALMANAIFICGRIEGINRPAIAGLFPTTSDDRPTLVLDVGANVDCKPSTLFQFGLMGSVYASLMTGKTSPRVGLLSIGEEKTKGNEQVVETWERFRNSGLNFVGNVEGRDILHGKADVVVCDGFVGNILLKFTESIKGFLTIKLRRQINKNLFSRLGAALLTPFLRRQRQTFDYSEYGGAPLLGINGVCIVCHGSSSPKAIKNAIRVASDMIRHRVCENIRDELVLFSNGNKNGQEDESKNNRSRFLRSVPSTDER
jgi:glycerol-3-phosphate acyltransferase PlsX